VDRCPASGVQRRRVRRPRARGIALGREFFIDFEQALLPDQPDPGGQGGAG
jgi:hypothetical protein